MKAKMRKGCVNPTRAKGFESDILLLFDLIYQGLYSNIKKRGHLSVLICWIKLLHLKHYC